jgi:hypothetical protein
MEWMLPRFGRRGEQVGSEGRPSRLVGESGDVLVGLVELCDGVGSEELFGCDVEGVGVALDRLEEPGRWVIELAQRGAGGERRFIAGEDLLQRLNRRTRGDGVGPDNAVGVAVADHLEVEVVGVPAAVSIVYSCCRDSCPVNRPCMVSAETPWAAWMVVA